MHSLTTAWKKYCQICLIRPNYHQMSLGSGGGGGGGGGGEGLGADMSLPVVVVVVVGVSGVGLLSHFCCWVQKLHKIPNSICPL